MPTEVGAMSKRCLPIKANYNYDLPVNYSLVEDRDQINDLLGDIIEKSSTHESSTKKILGRDSTEKAVKVWLPALRLVHDTRVKAQIRGCKTIEDHSNPTFGQIGMMPRTSPNMKRRRRGGPEAGSQGVVASSS